MVLVVLVQLSPICAMTLLLVPLQHTYNTYYTPIFIYKIIFGLQICFTSLGLKHRGNTPFTDIEKNAMPPYRRYGDKRAMPPSLWIIGTTFLCFVLNVYIFPQVFQAWLCPHSPTRLQHDREFWFPELDHWSAVCRSVQHQLSPVHLQHVW